jgi:Protein of unknown function (DUF3866)
MLKLRRARVVAAGPVNGSEQSLRVQLAGEPEAERAAIADVSLVGPAEAGDEVIVNVQALDLGLGSGGFDVVHVNVSRGLAGEGSEGAEVMKLNYTSLQHAVVPVEREGLRVPLERPAGVLGLHGQLAPVAWAFARAAPERSLGYVQTEGGALPGGHSRTVRDLRERGLLAGHITAGAAFGGEEEAMTTAGAIHHGLRELSWDAVVCGPGPGIVGSRSALGHGGMAALDSAHAALALGCRTLLVARMSSADPRGRHRGISHHTLTVLELLLEPVTVALPAGMRSPFGSEELANLRSAGLSGASASSAEPDAAEPGAADADGADVDGAGGEARSTLEVERPERITRHDWRPARVDLTGFAGSGLEAQTMGRGVVEDPLFFAAALAGGEALAELLGAGQRAAPRVKPRMNA